jgi:hypothetical protein
MESSVIFFHFFGSSKIIMARGNRRCSKVSGRKMVINDDDDDGDDDDLLFDKEEVDKKASQTKKGEEEVVVIDGNLGTSGGKKGKNLLQRLKESPPKKVKPNEGAVVNKTVEDTKQFIHRQSDESTKIDLKKVSVVESGRVLWYEEKDNGILTVYMGDVDDDSDLEVIVCMIRDEPDIDSKNEKMAEIRRLSVFDAPKGWVRPAEGSEICLTRATGHKLFTTGQAQFNGNAMRVREIKKEC